jgi:hypothetical protein
MSSSVRNKLLGFLGSKAPVITQPADIVIEPIMPDLLLGISPGSPELDSATKDELELRFVNSKRSCCEVCGVSLVEKFRHCLFLGEAWYNSCGMCFYPSNIDLIPSLNHGSIICFPQMSQARLNSLLRASWVLEYFRDTDSGNKDLKIMSSSISTLKDVWADQTSLTASYFKSADISIYASMLHLLRPEEYASRYKMFSSIRLLHDQRNFADEIAFWATTECGSLHPKNISKYMNEFTSKYLPGFDLRE